MAPLWILKGSPASHMIGYSLPWAAMWKRRSARDTRRLGNNPSCVSLFHCGGGCALPEAQTNTKGLGWAICSACTCPGPEDQRVSGEMNWRGTNSSNSSLTQLISDSFQRAEKETRSDPVGMVLNPQKRFA
jgi:hypothetical protein